MRDEKFDKPWIRAQRRTIRSNLTNRYGEQWRKLLGADIQKAVIEAEVLRLIMAQVMEKYTPAQELVRAVIATPDLAQPALILEEEIDGPR